MFFFVRSQSCAAITTIRVENIPSPEKEILCSWAVTPQTPGKNWLTFCLFGYACSGNFLENTIVGPLWPAPFTQHNVYKVHPCCSTLTTYFHSFLWLNNIPLYGQTTVCLSVHQLMAIWAVSILGSYEYATNIHGQVFAWTYISISLGYIARNGMAGSDQCFKCLQSKYFSQ